jgi:hypothetical protein
MNMSYCRWENTLADLEDCYDNIEDDHDLSEEEAKARQKTIALCVRIAENYANQLE